MVIIIGCGGSGKSTLTRELSKKVNLPVVHLDKIFWKEDWINISVEEFDKLLNEEIIKEKWILDGNYQRTLKERLKYCDTVIYLDYPRRTCLYGVIKRVLSNYGRVRLDMADGCLERFDLDFMKWIWNFNKTHRDNFYNILKEENDKEIHIFKNRKECNEFIKNL